MRRGSSAAQFEHGDKKKIQNWHEILRFVRDLWTQMAPRRADEDLLEKIRRVVRRRGANSPEQSRCDSTQSRCDSTQSRCDSTQSRCDSTKSRCTSLRQLLWREMGNLAFKETINAALMEFTVRGRHHEAMVLLDFDANPDYRGLNGYTLLHKAVERGDAKMVEILMKCGASASKTSRDQPPLVLACMFENLDCVKTLLEFGADPNTEDKQEGKTPLMWGVKEQKSLDLLELLLENGADPNLQSSSGGRLETELYDLILWSLWGSEEELPKQCVYALKAVRLLLLYGFRPLCCGRHRPGSLLKLSLENFARIFPLAVLLLEREEPFEPEHPCWSRFEVLREALLESLRGRSEAEAHPLLDKANALLDLAIVRPPMLRFTLRPGAHGDHQGAEQGAEGAELWAVDTAPASLQSLCRALVRRSLLPWPLEPKIQTLPLPELLKDLLKPLSQEDED